MALSLSQHGAEGAWTTSTSTVYYITTEARNTAITVNQTGLIGKWFDVKMEATLESANEFSCEIKVRNLSSMRLLNVQVGTGLRFGNGTRTKQYVTRIGDLGPGENRTVADRMQVNFSLVTSWHIMRFWGMYYVAATAEERVTTTQTLIDYLLAISETHQTTITRTYSLEPGIFSERPMAVYIFFVAAIGIIILYASLERSRMQSTQNDE